MSNINPVQKLGVALLKEKLAKRNPKNLNEALDNILWRFKIDSETGDIQPLDMITNKPTGQTPDEFLDNLKVDRSDMFTSGGNTAPAVNGNPFDRKSPHYNLSEGMKLYRNDPETARKLAFEAGVKL